MYVLKVENFVEEAMTGKSYEAVCASLEEASKCTTDLLESNRKVFGSMKEQRTARIYLVSETSSNEGGKEATCGGIGLHLGNYSAFRSEILMSRDAECGTKHII